MIIIIRHKKIKKKWKNAINAVHLLVQRRLRKVWRNPDPEGSSAYFHWTEKETFPEIGFFLSLLFFLMHFIWHYLILNRVSLSWSHNKMWSWPWHEAWTLKTVEMIPHCNNITTFICILFLFNLISILFQCNSSISLTCLVLF